MLYLTPGCFDKGGISRYSRYQISALREIIGENNIYVCSLLGPDANSIEEYFHVNYYGSSNNKIEKLKFALYAIWILILKRPKIIISAHIHFGFLTELMSRLNGAKVIQNVYGLEVRGGRKALVKRGLKVADLIISDCHATKEYLSKKYKDISTKIEVIWDCVDITKFHPIDNFTYIQSKYNLPDRGEHFIILTLGRLVEGARYKGYHRLIKVIAMASERKSEIRLIVAGFGELKDELEEYCRQYCVNDKVHFIGSVDENDLSAIYSYAHIFSLVTESGENKGEGLPLTPLEAMACGTPIIVGNQDGSNEAIFESVNGVIIDPYDLQSHANFIIKVAKDNGLLNCLSKEALRIIEQEFTYDRFRWKHNVLINYYCKR